MHFRKLNTMAGWLVFAIAAGIYLNTIEPTVSFWDCGEFISCAYKLEVGHQPGAPFFLLLGRIASLFAGHHPTHVAKMVNGLSALAGAFSIMFLFWTITLLARKISGKANLLTLTGQLAIFGSGLVGALTCLFSDTFWFSAVEGEVYATSSLFTSVVFWAILKWEEAVDQTRDDHPVSGADRWIILIAYLMGLSIGVHLLNLLTIPALVLVYYFKKYPASAKGLLLSTGLSLLLLAFVVFGFIPWIVKLAAWFDLLFVNGFGLPVNSGALTYLVVLAMAIILLLKHSHKRNKVLMNSVIIVFSVMLIGYSSYIMLAIRAEANPPINLSKVNNPFSLVQYINRDQYVVRPLWYGPYYNAPITGIQSKFTHVPVDGKYIKTEVNSKYRYDKRYMTLFPRMSSDDPKDMEAYKRWANIKSSTPTFADNLHYFFRYQVGYMYLRYFMWNFSGRQTENQGTGDILNGNWISGIKMLDELRLGPQDSYPQTLKKNKGRNEYYMLPLLLGLLGMLFHAKTRRKDFMVVLFFFLLTGLAIVVYLNEIPATPRERDYAVGGSFYVFCIWIGLGVVGLVEQINRRIPAILGTITGIAICLACVPGIMARENFDDHNRSHRYLARDVAYDYLNSCAPNAILFTLADNDTYPLWYAQEVEGIRTDVRVIIASFLSGDWYIQQLDNWRNNAPPVKLTISGKKYASGSLNHVPYIKRTGKAAKLIDVVEFLGSNDPRTMVKTINDSDINYFPTNRFTLPSGSGSATPEFSLNRKNLLKHEVVLLDIIASNPLRPVYFLSIQVPKELGLIDYLQLDGFAYRLVQAKYPSDGYNHAGSIRPEELYQKLMHTFKWGNMNDPEIFMDYQSIRTTNVLGIRSCFTRLAEEYIKQQDHEKALRVLDRCMEIMPHEAVPYDISVLQIIAAYYNAGARSKAMETARRYEQIIDEEIAYYGSLQKNRVSELTYEIRVAQYVLEQLEDMKKRMRT